MFELSQCQILFSVLGNLNVFAFVNESETEIKHFYNNLRILQVIFALKKYRFGIFMLL